MGYSETRHYNAIIKRQIRSGRATSKTEVIRWMKMFQIGLQHVSDL